MSALKKNLLEFIHRHGTAYSKLERQAGLSKNFISNVLRNETRHPSIDAVAKIADAMNISIDELVGRKIAISKNKDITANNLEMLNEVIQHMLKLVQKHLNKVSIDVFLNGIKEAYKFSIKKGKLDKEFIQWYVETYF